MSNYVRKEICLLRDFSNKLSPFFFFLICKLYSRIIFILITASPCMHVARQAEGSQFNGSGSLLLRHSVPIKTVPFPTFRRILELLRDEVRNSTPCFASLPERGNENVKYYIFSSGNGTYNQSYLQSHVCVPVPRVTSKFFYTIFYHGYIIIFIYFKIYLSTQYWNLQKKKGILDFISHFYFPEYRHVKLDVCKYEAAASYRNENR